MQIILHLGAHRAATTSFQTYLRAHRADLEERQLGFWGPWRTRKGLLHGVAEAPESPEQARRATGRVRLALEGARKTGIARLVVSDENMLGMPRRCLRQASLYPGAGERVARLAQAFGQVNTICIQVRALDAWWASLIGHVIPRGEAVPSDDTLACIAANPRSWRELVTELACACPEAEIVVTPFEAFCDRPDRLLTVMSGLTHLPVARPGAFWRNRRLDLRGLRTTLSDRGEDPGHLPEGEGRYMPFTEGQRARLREAYADDLFWLEAGADGLATLKADPDPGRRRLTLAAGLKERGHTHDGSPRRLARDR
ncbi:hypothetical protein [Sagittula sp.]|uniref:hypothetical protein n=1 Tax=Sagittula sp. TaxID=2038081 RepID=UPI003515EF55